MNYYAYLFLCYREILWELECESSCLKRYNKDYKKLKQKEKQILKQIKRSKKCSLYQFDQKHLSHKMGNLYKELKFIESLKNITQPIVKELRLLKKTLENIFRLYMFLVIHTQKSGIKKQDNTIKYYYKKLKRKAAGAAFFAIYFLIRYNNYNIRYQKIMLKSKMNFEEMGDYSYELLEEISRLVSELPESNFITSNKFIDINNKLNKAKSLGMNVSKYEEQIYNFRCSLLKRKIADKIKKIDKLSNTDHSVLDISSIENNYLELKNDFEDLGDVDTMFQQLQNLIVKTKIGEMIQKYISGESNSSFDFENIIREINNAKSKNIDVHKLEMLMLGD